MAKRIIIGAAGPTVHPRPDNQPSYDRYGCQDANPIETICATCEEAYTWGVQHGSMSAKVEARLPLPHVDWHLLERQAAVIGALKEEPFLSGEQRSCLEGLWNFLHALLDRAEDRSQ